MDEPINDYQCCACGAEFSAERTALKLVEDSCLSSPTCGQLQLRRVGGAPLCECGSLYVKWLNLPPELV